MLRMKRWCPGTSTNATGQAALPNRRGRVDGDSARALFGQLVGVTPVSAHERGLPWSMWRRAMISIAQVLPSAAWPGSRSTNRPPVPGTPDRGSAVVVDAAGIGCRAAQLLRCEMVTACSCFFGADAGTAQAGGLRNARPAVPPSRSGRRCDHPTTSLARVPATAGYCSARARI